MHEKVVQYMKYIVQKATQKGVTIGTFIDTIENAMYWKKTGVQYLSYSVDVGIFANACQTIVRQIKEV